MAETRAARPKYQHLVSQRQGGGGHRSNRGFVVVSGLPASGKSVLAAAIAPLLDLPLLDKDDFLEALFERDGIGDAPWRERLSRESDVRFRDAASNSASAILTSFWRHPGLADGGGTPTDWLTMLPGPLVEVHCRCPARLALERFQTRARHPGHLDAELRRKDLQRRFDSYAARGPLGLGTAIDVCTTGPFDARVLAARIRGALGADS